MKKEEIDNIATWKRLEQSIQRGNQELYEPTAISRSKSTQHIKVGAIWFLVGSLLTVSSCYLALHFGYVVVFTGAIIKGLIKIVIGIAQLMHLDTE